MAGLVAARASASVAGSAGLVAGAGHLAGASAGRLLCGAALVPLSETASHYGENGKVDLRDLLTALQTLSGATMRVSLGELAGGRRVRLQLVEENPDQLEPPPLP